MSLLRIFLDDPQPGLVGKGGRGDGVLCYSFAFVVDNRKFGKYIPHNFALRIGLSMTNERSVTTFCLGLCYQDEILWNLWQFFAMLGPNFGLKSFLELLAVSTSVSSPEILMLNLFCDCMTHYVT